MYLKFLNDETLYEITGSIDEFSSKICIYQSDIPENTSGFEIITEDDLTISYADYTTIFGKTEDYIIFTSKSEPTYIFYLYDDNGYVNSYYIGYSLETPHNNAILVRSGVGLEYESVALEEIFNEDNSPKFKVIEGELIEIVNEEEKILLSNQQLQKAKEEKIRILSNICSELVVKGIEYNGENFSYQIEDQNNLYNSVQLSLTTGLDMPYHADGGNCRLFTKDELVAIYAAQETNLTHNITYNNQLKQYINTLNTIEEVNMVYYGQELEGEYLDTYNQIMTHAQTVVEAFLNGQV